ncbi:uncharacterized protein LOC120111464 [Phoenix dactylifera]|uniref:Uncharacterized protein LOC120111464 n=1 Tax=Phoenix dactylifera TaxID=42345 RepID=A0A8B9ADA1_PHODC|nr:uncharacterized protein LOC120111464 [Phoenix dactylifera]
MVDTDRLVGYRVSKLLFSEKGGWREGLIRETFGEHLAERILTLRIPSREEPDRLAWVPTERSRVHARDLRTLISRKPARQMDGGWIWRMRIHLRVALFLWKVAWGCLPPRRMLAGRGVQTTPFCEACSDIEETVTHVILSCPKAAQIWERLSVPLPHTWESVKDLLHHLLESMRRPSTVEKGIRRAYLAYHIWLDRNARLFEGSRSIPRTVVDRAFGMLRRSPRLPRRDSIKWLGTSRIPVLLLQCPDLPYFWVPPPLGHLKVNFNGYRSRDGVYGGAGFVIRDHQGRLIAAGG